MSENKFNTKEPFVIILGIAQDGGVPHAGCYQKCCRKSWADPGLKKFSTCLGIVDPQLKKRWLIEATPDFKFQLKILDGILPFSQPDFLSAVFITHGHIGHFSGIWNLGRSVLNYKNLNLFLMPKMIKLFSNNIPWSDLLQDKNVVLREAKDNQKIKLSKNIFIKPFLVPHRGSDFETVGFEIIGQKRKVIFIPDTNKWKKCDFKIEDKIKQSDLVLLDGTFFDENELPNRDMSKVPHPFIKQSIERFKKMDFKNRNKIKFIHLNHTNPVLNHQSKEYKEVIDSGLNVAEQGKFFNI